MTSRVKKTSYSKWFPGDLVAAENYLENFSLTSLSGCQFPSSSLSNEWEAHTKRKEETYVLD